MQQSLTHDTTGSYGLGRGTSQDKTLTVGTVIPAKIVTTAIGANLASQSTNDFNVYTNRACARCLRPNDSFCLLLLVLICRS